MPALRNLLNLFLSTLLSLQTVNAQSGNTDTAVYQYQTPGSSIWINSSMNVSTYNSDCKYSQIETYLWNDISATWYNYSKVTYSYDAAGILLQELDQQWNNVASDWQNQNLIKYTTSGNIKKRSTAQWNSIDNQWHKTELDVDSVDGNGNVVKNAIWFGVNDTLQPASRTKYLYNEQQQKAGELSYQITNGIYNKSKYNYTNNDLSVEVKGLYRFNEQDPWQNSTKDFTNLSAVTKLKSFHLLQIYADGQWYNIYRDSFTYTNNNQLNTAYHQYWDFYVDSAWKKFYIDQQDYYKDGSLHHVYSVPWGENPYGNYCSKVTYTHHGCMLQLQAITDDEHARYSSALRQGSNKYIFDALPVKYSKTKSIVPHYMLVTRKASLQATVSANAITPASGVIVYPNPAKDYVKLQVTDMSLRNAHIVLTDISGKTVYTGVYNNTTQTIQLPKLTAGIYLLHLQSGTKIITQKLVIK
ncbi:T9SS type A sorting domain-containing protein [Panacibacter ginsenosidivorans]|uniref:T9SS type A sorting domain-containing protein n=1 Tax=Panacibacter ginsenosidivorans TaxID=1813871 RepID=A0A5B8V6A6_9BACT|nr:T9SS type A sorting domain-containing protein [Panacibacter ginsenosidivorans]QEC66782.1 T9SS type A sorting domain-containing protein [Panacibacter ginsenosidivorans]